MVSLYETYTLYCLNPCGMETLDLEVLNGKLSLRNTTVHFRIDPVTKVHVIFFID